MSRNRKVELAGVGPLGHDLKRRIGRAADHRHAHELEAEALHLGLDLLGDRNVVLLETKLSDRSRGPSLRHLTMSRREPRYSWRDRKRMPAIGR